MTAAARRAIPWFAFVAILVAFVPYRELFTSRVPVARDLPFYFYPLKAHLGQAIRSGQVPWIDPTRWGGVPLLGAPGAAAFYPANVLFVVLPLGAAMKGWILLHLALAVAGFASFASRLGLGKRGAALAGLLFGLGGVAASLAPFCGAFSSLALLPWFAAAIFDLRENANPRTLVRTALLAGLILLAGLPEFAFYALLIAAAVLARRGPSLARSLSFACLAALLAGALAAPQVIPSVSTALGSVRGPGGGMNEITAREKSLARPRLVELLSDGIVADWTKVAMAKEVREYPYLPSITPGMVALLLAALGLLSGGRGRLVASLLVVLGIGLALGPPSPVWRAAARVVPFFLSLRYPEKHLVLAAFGFAWLAALGLGALERRLGAGANVIAGLLALAVLVDRERTARLLLETDSAACLAETPGILKPFVAGVGPGLSPPRIFHRDSYAPVPVFETFDLLASNRKGRASLEPGYASLFGAGYIFEPDYDVGLPREAVEWNRLMMKSTPSGAPLHDRIVRSAGVSAVLRSLPRPDGAFVATLLPLQDPLPPYRFVSRVVSDPDGRRLFGRFLEEGADPFAAWVVRAGSQPVLTVSPGRVLRVSDRAGGLTIDVEVAGPQDGYLVLFRLLVATEEASLDGRRVEVEETAFGFSGLSVPPGRHHLLFRPSGQPVRWGLALAGLAIAAAAAAWRLGGESMRSPRNEVK